MSEANSNVSIPQSLQELEQAIQRYRASDLNDPELLAQWQAIRDASLAQKDPEPGTDKVPGEASY